MSIAQPSAQGIASLYRGNPGALDARIKQEQQAKPGMPPDLMKMLALSIDLNEQDAVKRQQAMSALQGMQQQAPTGKPPTVAESLQQQAAQKAKQLAVQQQQQQKGLQALMGQAAPAQTPERPPQPEHQGSIDELQSNLGQEYAGGGIVAFDGGGATKDKLRPYPLSEQGADWEARMQAERDAEDARGATSPAGDVARGLASLVKRGASAVGDAWDNLSERQKIRQQIEQNRPGMFEALTDEERAARKVKAQALAGQMGRTVDGEPTAAADPADIRAQLNAAEAKMQPSTSVAAPAKDLAALAAAQRQRAQGTQGAQGSPTASTTAAPASAAAPMSARDKFLASQYEMTPAQRRDEALKRYAEQVGGPDVSAQERYISELERSRKRFETPKDTWGKLMEYAGNIAEAGGRTWGEAGAKGAALGEQKRKALAQQDMDVLKELMAESGKVADVKRGYKKEVFGIGEKEYDDAYKNAFDAAKEQGLDDREATKLAHQAAEGKLNRANALAVANVRSSGSNAEDKQRLNELKTLLAAKTAGMKNKYGSELARLKAEAAPIEAAIAKMAGLDTMATAPGAGSPGGTTTGWGKASVVK